MNNCLIAQSGGPTSVINASVTGLLEANSDNNIYDTVYGGLYGIEGIMENKFINLSNLSKEDLFNFKHTPSSGLGSCRYKLKKVSESCEEYEKIFDTFKELNIRSFFYIGGNDSMDTVLKLSSYAAETGKNVNIIGIPKTIDNDLPLTDHTPGFGSAAKFISAVTLDCYFDTCVYKDNGIFILETMGRNTGWLAARSILGIINEKPVADFIYVPESPFYINKFLSEVTNKYMEQKRVFIVAAEGLKNDNGIFISKLSPTNTRDKFGHTQLGGVGTYLKYLITKSGITNRVKVLELNILQRCAAHYASAIDIEEASMVGRAALMYSKDNVSGKMVGIKRLCSNPYSSEPFLIDAAEAANGIKYFPKEWIDTKNSFIRADAYKYFLPLIQGIPDVNMNNNIKYISLIK